MYNIKYYSESCEPVAAWLNWRFWWGGECFVGWWAMADPAQVPAEPLMCLHRAARDTRRDTLPGGPKKLERYGYDVTAKDEALDALPTAPTPNTQWPHHKWGKFRPILDQDNNGYTL